MPPHEGHDHHDDDHGHPGAAATGLPVHQRRLRPGAVGTGAVIAAVAALAAHVQAVRAGLVWDDAEFLLRDERVRSLGTVLRAWTEPFFRPEIDNEMYRPLVNASLAFDWAVSSSDPGSPTAWWFHLGNLLVHALNAALVYVFLGNLTKRKLGAPLLAAVLWAVHPLTTEPVTWIVGRCDLYAAACALGAGILFLRSPGKPLRMWGAAALWGLSLFAKASAALLPGILALGLVAYHGLDASRLASPRVRNRFLVFLAPAALWAVATTLVLGSPVPVADGVTWRWNEVGFGEALLGTGRAVFVHLGQFLLPVRLSGDYAGDPAWLRGDLPWTTGLLGWAVLLTAAVLGARLLRRHAVGFPLLAFVLALVPVLQFARIGAIFADRYLYFPSVFLFLLVAEGLEHLYYRWGTRRGLLPTFLLFGASVVLCHARAPVWRDDVAFHRDVIARVPSNEAARTRLALALSETGSAEDRAEALALLDGTPATSPQRGRASALAGAVRLESGDFAGAERDLRAAAEHPTTGQRSRAMSWYNLAVLARAVGRPEEAPAFLRKALAVEPELDAARALLRIAETR